MSCLKGLFTALVTPFDHRGHFNEEGFRITIQSQLENQVDGLVILGTTGEASTLSEQEKQHMIRTALDEIGSKAPLIVGTGSNSTKQSVENTKIAKELGAEFALVVIPYYNKPTQEGLFLHFKTIAEAVPLPLIIYNNPGRCGTTLSIPTMQRLSKIPNIIGVKEVTSNIDHVNNLIEAFHKHRNDFSILSGDDSTTFSMIAAGGHGVVSVAANLIPGRMRELIDSALSENFIEARHIHFELLPLFKALNIETNPIPIKTAMNICGLPAGPCRLPLCDLLPENRLTLEETLQKMTLTKAKIKTYG